ncbi:peptide ABC transporter [Corynebacterium tapiri]|uniref:Peptide ABC transporter n=1 Tax=Corynebacterium tapiri TaxID=1448266 RepID=A0A5C4U5A4_9CORY|nr:peptide ABC transporter [Corynebacterium tapiri]
MACSSGDGAREKKEPKNESYFGYQVNAPLVTTNAASVTGKSVNAEVLSARLYPGPFVHGPAGQMIPNTDLATAEQVEAPVPTLKYTIAPEARYSDGNPITCVDFQLSYMASVHTDIFRSNQPLMSEIASLDCALDSKEFTVTFQENKGSRWRELFTPGTVLPAHALAAKAGTDEAGLHAALNVSDYSVLQPVAEAWNTGFDLANFDPALQVSAGPFVIDHVGEQGEVALRRNPEYNGDPAELEKLIVWPRQADSAALAASGALKVAEAATATPSWVNRDDQANPFAIESVAGIRTESLVMSPTGTYSDPWARESLSACVDRAAVARVSTERSGVKVDPVAFHTIDHANPIGRLLEDIAAAHSNPDIARASQATGAHVRIGYAGPDERKAAMVEAIRVSCEPAGITVVDASQEGATMAGFGDPVTGESTIDAFLTAIDPMTFYPASAPDITKLNELRADEEEQWKQLPAIPLAAEPRAFVRHREVGNVVEYTGATGIGWNMDRWHEIQGEEDKR